MALGGVVVPLVAQHADQLGRQRVVQELQDVVAPRSVARRDSALVEIACGRTQRLLVEHAHEESAHADRLAERIVQLGGEPDFAPDGLSARSHADYDASSELRAMVSANLVAERIAVESYRQMIALIADKDPTTRRILEDILSDEEEHADELKDLLAD